MRPTATPIVCHPSRMQPISSEHAKGKMSDTVTIKVFEVVGGGVCVASSDGQKVHDQIAAALKASRAVDLSFANVKSLTSAFLNAAIGQLYGDFSEQKIRANLSVSAMAPEDIALLRRVVETAKQYFKDPNRVNRIVGETLHE